MQETRSSVEELTWRLSARRATLDAELEAAELALAAARRQHGVKVAVLATQEETVEQRFRQQLAACSGRLRSAEEQHAAMSAGVEEQDRALRLRTAKALEALRGNVTGPLL